MKAHFTKVYSGPGYPLDPKREEERMLVGFLNDYSCVISSPPMIFWIDAQHPSIDNPVAISFAR